VPRVVLDTNVYISAYGFGGKPGGVLRAAIAGEYTLLTSPAVLTEVADKLYAVLGFDDEHVRAVIMQVSRIAEIVRPEARLTVVSDEPDNRILECAVAGEAGLIVSGDHHLLDLGAYHGMRVLCPAAFLAELSRAR
jgi:putative PIN family toxin of toxin-antitoxin system